MEKNKGCKEYNGTVRTGFACMTISYKEWSKSWNGSISALM